ncbi:type II toxin-antitoxin system VapC family toxin [Consotaella aegiceratis]|uniref:type II toxin-antitoxin system VapC family toxin n=1 Tax=Consotaella aegiceratis TaxID=3097961 RepID=UPI002F418C7A
MTTSTLVDSNILIDLLGTGPLAQGSVEALVEAFGRGDIVISAVVWAEIAVPGLAEELLLQKVSWLRPRREALPFEAAFPAGLAHRRYRERGGRRERTLPDFLIGAHALIRGHCLLTRDASRYRSYFPELDIISPDTHP